MNIVKAGYILKWYGRKFVSKVTKRAKVYKKYIGHPILTPDETNQCIAQAIKSGTPFMAGRYGANELNVMWRVNDKKPCWDVEPSKALFHLHEGAGFFPDTKEAALKFVEQMRMASKQLDMIAVWFNPMEDFVIKKWGAKDYKLCSLMGLEPFFANSPWTMALEGKKVLVIHPFADTIVEQYKKRKELFARDILPEFELHVQRAVQTIAGNKDERFETWFDALDFMYEEAMKTDFDVAIVGCGAYGFPLAARIKEAGKVAIHLGGSTQLLFGIRGARWETMKSYQALFTEAWVRPAKQEVPQNAKSVEQGCYW